LGFYELSPSDFGLPPGDEADLRGGSPAENARALSDLLDGRGPAGLRRAVAANAALALRAAGLCEDLREGAGRALEALATGSAGRHLRERVLGAEEANDARAS
jgi:anthranilate phosphoribosyltransferase